MTLSVFVLFDFSKQRRSDAVIGTLIVIGATVFFCWWGARLKQVSIDEHNIYVASVFREISIPFTGIHFIYELQGGWPVVVRLKEKSEFGRTIFFLAKSRFMFPWQSHPIVQQLRPLINENQNNQAH